MKRVYANFEQNLGDMDRFNEWIEVCVRYTLSACVTDYNALAKMMGVGVCGLEKGKLKPFVSRHYICGVYRETEAFLKKFVEVHPKGARWQKHDEDTCLDTFLRAMSMHGDRLGVDAKLFDYYRLVRNATVHSKSLNKELPLPMGCEDHGFASLKAPNGFDEITFDDFILFSRSMKRLAETCCRVLSPTADEVYEWLINPDHKLPQRKIFLTARKHTQSKAKEGGASRLHEFLSRGVGHEFGMSPAEINLLEAKIRSQG